MNKHYLKEVIAEYQAIKNCSDYSYLSDKKDHPPGSKQIKKLIPGAVVRCIQDCKSIALVGFGAGKDAGEYPLAIHRFLADGSEVKEFSVWRKNTDGWSCLYEHNG